MTVKIRLSGLPDECRALVDLLSEATSESVDLTIREVSGEYPNRGESKLVRIYIDADITAVSK